MKNHAKKKNTLNYLKIVILKQKKKEYLPSNEYLYVQLLHLINKTCQVELNNKYWEIDEIFVNFWWELLQKKNIKR